MSERPGAGRPGQDPGQDPREGPDFGWLSGRRRGASGSPGDDAEATQRLPVQPRPGPPTENLRRPAAQPGPAQAAGTPPRPPAPAPAPQRPAPTPYQPPTPPPGRRGGGFWARRARHPCFWVRAVLALLLLWVLYIVAVPVITWQSAEKVAFEPDGERPPEQDGTTYLMVGSDSRRDLTEEERKEYSTGNPSSELTDTILLLHTGGGPSVLLSLPRDTQVDRPFYSGKINAAYARGGAPLLTRVVEAETGIRVDQYVEIGLGGVANVVDAVGGITINPRERLKDPLAGLDVRKGEQEVNGATALAYARSRKQSTLGDLERVRRQREVIGAVGDRVLSPWTVVNPIRWWRINRAVPTFFTFGDTTSVFDAGSWALAMSRSSSGDNLTCTVPVTDTSANTWDRERADPLFQAIIDDSTGDITPDQCTPSGLAP